MGQRVRECAALVAEGVGMWQLVCERRTSWSCGHRPRVETRADRSAATSTTTRHGTHSIRNRMNSGRYLVIATMAAIAAGHFAADAVVAARLGYTATSRSWDGEKLTVVYQLQPPGENEAPVPPPAGRMAANALANQARAEANAQANQARVAGRDPVGLPPPPLVAPRSADQPE